LILTILSSGDLFAKTPAIFTLSVVLIAIGFIPRLFTKVTAIRRKAEKEKMEWIRYRTSLTENS